MMLPACPATRRQRRQQMQDAMEASSNADPASILDKDAMRVSVATDPPGLPTAVLPLKHASTGVGRSVTITLQDVSYSVINSRKGPDKGKPLYLLRSVSAFFTPGQMSSLMGPSGSGKTTLLDLLAGRKTVGKMEGDILFSGIKPTQEYLRRYAGYVEQFDTLLGILTPYEMLLYTAELKRPLSEPLAKKKDAVENLLQLLALDTCRNVRIGTTLNRGISGGQAKRVNIGLALITDARVLFLDEPTTGLDSYTANEVMNVVKDVARTGVTVVATVHSPTAYTFNLFDSLLLLVGGRTVYFGKPGKAAVEFFQQNCPHIKAYTPGYNDAEYLVDLVTEADRFGKGAAFADAYANSTRATDTAAALQEMTANQHEALPSELLKELQVSRATVTPMWWGLWVQFKYRTTRNYRDPAFLAPRIMDKVVISLLVMTLYLGVGDDDSASNVINVSAILFMWTGTAGFSASSYIPALFLERGTYVREKADGLYLTITYLISRIFDELLINGVVSLVVSAYTFYGIQLQGEFVLFWMAYYVSLATGIVLAYFVASFAPSMDVANALLPVYAVTLMFFAGFLIRLDDLPPWWKWYSYIDFGRYSFGANMINQFSHSDLEYIGGKTVLQFYSFDGVKDKWTYVGYVALFFIFFFVSTWAVLNYKRYSLR